MQLFSRLSQVKPRLAAATAFAMASMAVAATPTLARASDEGIQFPLSRSAAIVKANCLPDARGTVTVEPEGPVEHMRVKVEDLPPNTEFDFFVIQVPNNPFGMAWYQGDIETNSHGVGHGRFIGRFSSETFIVANNPPVPAPSVHNNAFPDATLNPVTGPIHTFHLGLWFNSPADAAKAGCPATVTPFNGDHNAGIQVLSTNSFPDLQGPLLQLKP